ncbi:hypothetical protein [Hydrogenovibrio kuenenii]|uniref:hypothetical protein n=1 Tax=Hydrogenovibrio kuenenii TaxID=63658 RepID=UPI000463417E|nr:hypothetical protein [Hydrogenovibrio kuenenii]
MSNSILPINERAANLLADSARNASVLPDLLKSRQENGDNNNKAGAPKSSQLDSFLPSKALQQASYSEQAKTQYSYSNTMTLNLTTKEGDKVSIDFRQLYSEYKAYQKQQGTDSGPQGSRAFESTSAMELTAFDERFGFSVKGDLNQDELKAIHSVFQQIDKLANHFFNGNVEKAFQKASDLNVDFGQLQSVSLNLTQTQSYVASYQKAAAYQNQTASQADASSAASKDGVSVAALPEHLQNMQKAIDTLSSHFKDARKVAEQLLSNVVASRFPEEGTQSVILQRLQKLHDALVNSVPLSETTLQPSGVVISSAPSKADQATNTNTADQTTKTSTVDQTSNTNATDQTSNVSGATSTNNTSSVETTTPLVNA